MKQPDFKSYFLCLLQVVKLFSILHLRTGNSKYLQNCMLFLVHLKYLDDCHHPAFTVFCQQHYLFNDQRGELSLAAVARIIKSQSPRLSADQIDIIYRRENVVSDECRRRLGVSQAYHREFADDLTDPLIMKVTNYMKTCIKKISKTPAEFWCYSKWRGLKKSQVEKELLKNSTSNVSLSNNENWKTCLNDHTYRVRNHLKHSTVTETKVRNIWPQLAAKWKSTRKRKRLGETEDDNDSDEDYDDRRQR
jgi:hypothetical protein